ncbi:MAG: hypothetical protein RLZZ568_638 [Cyanobacteriota bacterium]|jgi:hypothetical protein
MRTFAWNSLLKSLFVTSAIMVSAGLGFGLALRSPSPPLSSSSSDPPPQPQTGGGLFQQEQTFPPRPGWNFDSEQEGENLDGARYNSLQMQ